MYVGCYLLKIEVLILFALISFSLGVVMCVNYTTNY